MAATRSFGVELVCYLCGNTRETEVDRLEQLRPAHCPVSHCGGRLFVTTATTVYHYGDPADLDFEWDADRPRRGRPLKKAPVHV